MDFQHSPKAQDYLKRVKDFMKNEIEPVEEAYLRELHSLDNKWVVLPIIRRTESQSQSRRPVEYVSCPMNITARV